MDLLGWILNYLLDIDYAPKWRVSVDRDVFRKMFSSIFISIFFSVIYVMLDSLWGITDLERFGDILLLFLRDVISMMLDVHFSFFCNLCKGSLELRNKVSLPLTDFVISCCCFSKGLPVVAKLFVPSVRCPSCGYANDCDFWFCQRCGYSRKIVHFRQSRSVGINLDEIDTWLNQL